MPGFRALGSRPRSALLAPVLAYSATKRANMAQGIDKLEAMGV